MTEILPRISKQRPPGSRWELLVVTLLLGSLYLVRQPGFLSGPALRVLDDLIILAVAILAMTVARVSRTTFLVHIGLGVLATGIAVAAEVASSSDLERVATAVSAYVLVAAAVAIILAILRQTRVSSDTVFGGLAVYLAVGIVFAMAYTALARSDPAQFNPPQLVLLSDASMYYFSFVTLTGLGYGDITPVTDFTRNLATFEALIGLLLLVTLVSRIVGLLVAQQSEQATEQRLQALDAHIERLEGMLRRERDASAATAADAGLDPQEQDAESPARGERQSS